MKRLAYLFTIIPLAAMAGGSNYGIAPGALPNLSGKVTEWPVPTPRFARDPAPGPDGNIYITVMSGNKIARFDTSTHAFREWELAPAHHPHGLLVDPQGIVWTTGNGTIGRLDPASGRFTEYPTPSRGGGPHTLIISNDGVIWFTLQSGNKIGRLDTRSTGQMTELAMGRGSMPRRIATAPDGMMWVTLYGNGKLAKVDAAAMKVVREYQLPAGDAGPYAVTIDGAGMVWANEINTDTVVRLNPANGDMRIVKLPSKNAGIRKMIVDAGGRLWYMGSHNGRLGMVE